MLNAAARYYPFYPSAIPDEAAFDKRINDLCREIDDRGKPKKPRQLSWQLSEACPNIVKCWGFSVSPPR